MIALGSFGLNSLTAPNGFAPAAILAANGFAAKGFVAAGVEVVGAAYTTGAGMETYCACGPGAYYC